MAAKSGAAATIDSADIEGRLEHSHGRRGKVPGGTGDPGGRARRLIASPRGCARIDRRRAPFHPPGSSEEPLNTTEPLLVARNLTRQLPSGGRLLTILDHVDLSIERGEFVAVLGPSGSGKSTLLALLAGLDRPTSGEVFLDGEPLHALSEDRLALVRRRLVGFVFQSYQLLGNLTARENILLPLELRGSDRPEERADRLLAEVGLADRGHHYPTQLSGGEQQRVALARAFATEPALLLADEPTGNLDGSTGVRILEILESLRVQSGTTLVLVTHDPAVAERAEREIRLRDGRIESDERRRRVD